MKRKISLVLLMCLFVVFISGCGSTEVKDYSRYDYITDCQLAKSAANSSNVNVAKCENGYYVAVGKFIYYVENSSMDSTVLCSKPNCLHDDELCNAYIGANDGIAYNNGYIYTFVDAGVDHEFIGNELKRINADGTEKEICFYTEFTPVDWIVHRGYLYYSVKKFQNIDYAQSTKCDAYIYRIPLDSANPKPEEVYFAEEVEHNSIVSELMAFDNYLYFWVGGDLRDNKGSEISKTLCMDLSTFDTKEMLSPKGEELFSPKLLGDKLVFGGGVTDEGYLYYKSDINGENIEPFMEIKKNEQITCDGKYLYVDNALGLTLGVAKGEIDKEDTVRTLSVYDSSLNLIDELCLESKGAYTWDLLPVDENIFLFGGKNSEEETVIFYLDKSEFGNINGDVWSIQYAFRSENEELNDNRPGALSESAPHGSDMLVDLWQKAKDKEYGVKDSFQSDGAEAEVGFSVRLIWEQDGGTFTAYFPFMEFENEDKAKGYINTNPYALQKGNVVVNIGVESVPQEVYNMLSSILDGTPVEPIDSKDFSGENFMFE